MSIRTRIAFSFLAVILLVVLVMGLYEARLLDQIFKKTASRQMTVLAERIEQLVKSMGVPATDVDAVRRLLSGVAAVIESRVIVTDTSGLIVADTAGGAQNLAGRSVPVRLISRAVTGSRVDRFEFPMAGQDAVAVALPWWTQDRVTGVMIIVRSLRQISVMADRELMGSLVRAGLVAAGVTLVAAIMLSRSITGPVSKMAEAAKAISRGEFSRRIETGFPGELGELASAMDTMSREISRLVSGLGEEKEKLRRVMEEREKMLSDISHDLRTPVTSIKGFAEALADVIKSEEDRRRAVAVIRDEADRLSRLVEDLFLLVRLESGELPFPVSEEDLSAIVGDTVSSMEPLAAKRGIVLSVDVPADPVPAVVCEDRLVRALSNLLDNAIKYSPPGGEVKVSLRTGDGVARVYIQDCGPGIAPDELPRIFDRFYRGDKSRSGDKPGAGLGLSIARFIVEKHGGKLEVETTVGRGSTFVITLPTDKTN